MKKTKPIPALQNYLSYCDKEAKELTARLAGTTVNNLHQIAGGHTGCSPALAIMLEAATFIVFRDRYKSEGGPFTAVRRGDLTDWFENNQETIKTLEKKLGTAMKLSLAWLP